MKTSKSDDEEEDFMLEKIKESKSKEKKDRINDEITKQKCKNPIFAKAIDAIRQPTATSKKKMLPISFATSLSLPQITVSDQKLLNLIKNDNFELDDKKSSLSSMKITRSVLNDGGSTKRLSVKDRLGDKVEDDSDEHNSEVNRKATLALFEAETKLPPNYEIKKSSRSKRRSRSPTDLNKKSSNFFQF